MPLIDLCIELAIELGCAAKAQATEFTSIYSPAFCCSPCKTTKIWQPSAVGKNEGLGAQIVQGEQP
jgi:hypothetical protein